jgi:hypothetical protein
MQLSEVLAKKTEKHHRNGPQIIKSESMNDQFSPVVINLKKSRPSSKVKSEFGTLGLDSIDEDNGKAEKRRRSVLRSTEKQVTMNELLFSPKSTATTSVKSKPYQSLQSNEKLKKAF